MNDRADDLCDLAKTVIETASNLPENEIPGTTVSVECDDDFDPDTAAMPTGQMKVAVSWEQYEDGAPATRKETTTDYTLVIIAVEVCEEQGKVPLAWRRKRSRWMSQCVVKALGDARVKLDGAYALRLDRTAFDLEELTERKAFWCGVAITFRDIRSRAA